MKPELRSRDSADALEGVARHLDARAGALWSFAGDCDRWGLGEDADEARAHARNLRVRAVINRAVAAGLRAKRSDSNEQLF